MPLGLPCGDTSGQLPPAFVAGMTAPSYGMPITGTPIGLPGPAHIPLGGPAGLKKHTITNHTRTNIPGPTKHLKLHVQQAPGLRYPKPASRAYVSERSDVPHIRLKQPRDDRTRWVVTVDQIQMLRQLQSSALQHHPALKAARASFTNPTTIQHIAR